MKHIFFFVLLLVPVLVAEAYVSSSTNYRLEAESINFAGGLSTSTNYSLESTAGEIATGLGTSTSYALHAGYQQMVASSITLSVPSSITLSPNIPTTGGGVANGNGSWTIQTDNPAGYTMTIRAAASPALVSGGNSFTDYTPAGSDPDFSFSVASGAREFGFTPEGTEVHQRYLDASSACNTGSGETVNSCWDALSTTDRTIAQRTTANAPSNSTITIKFRAEAGSSNTPPAGAYQATTTVTVLAR